MTVQYWIGAAAGVVLHEAAHALVAVLLGLKVKQVGICVRGIYVKRQAGNPMQDALIAAAGPVTNLLLCCTWPWLPEFALANAVFGVVYSLPISNSDGSRVLAAITRWRASRPSLYRRTLLTDQSPGA